MKHQVPPSTMKASYNITLNLVTRLQQQQICHSSATTGWVCLIREVKVHPTRHASNTTLWAREREVTHGPQRAGTPRQLSFQKVRQEEGATVKKFCEPDWVSKDLSTYISLTHIIISSVIVSYWNVKLDSWRDLPPGLALFYFNFPQRYKYRR